MEPNHDQLEPDGHGHGRRPVDRDLDVDVAVVGGGLAGLIAAADAAAAGARVVVLESRRHLGGRADTVERDGFRLNAGPHALYPGGALCRAIERHGIRITGRPPLLAAARARRDDELHQLPVDARSLLSTTLLSNRGKAQFGRLLTTLTMARFDPAPTTTVEDWLDDLTDRDEVRGLMAALVRVSTYGNAEMLFSAGAAAAQVRRANRGVRYLDGGWQTLVDGFASAARRHGAEIHAGSPVERLDFASVPHRRGGDGWELSSGDHAITAGAVILALPPATAARLIVGDDGDVVHPYTDLGPAVTATCLDIGTDTPAPVTFCLGVDRPLYLSHHTPPTDLAPHGTALVAVARYRSPDDDLTPEQGEAELVDHARRCGVDVDGARLRRYLHRMVVTQTMPLAERGGLSGRPAVAVPRSAGLFVAGDWVGLEGLLGDAAAASAASAAFAASAASGAANTPESSVASRI